MTDQITQRLSFALSNPTSNEDGSYEILAITSGLGNGWKFSPATLQKSLSHWDGVHCFLDHSLNQRSIKDIAGILTNPVFDEETQGIRATLTPFGPGANLLTSIAPVLTNAQTDLKVGFSADLSFIGASQIVKEIVKVHSVDLVVNPARGGKFLRATNSEDKGEYMKEEETKEMTEDRRPETSSNSETHSNSTQDRQARSFPNGTHAVAKEAQDGAGGNKLNPPLRGRKQSQKMLWMTQEATHASQLQDRPYSTKTSKMIKSFYSFNEEAYDPLWQQFRPHYQHLPYAFAVPTAGATHSRVDAPAPYRTGRDQSTYLHPGGQPAR